MRFLSFLSAILLFCHAAYSQRIDRQAVVSRHNPAITSVDTLGSLTVGNGAFAFTVDATGLQSMPEYYYNGIALCTQSEWGWHSAPNPEGYTAGEALRAHDLGHNTKRELYSCQIKDNERGKAASDWLRANPHRLNLGVLGFAGIEPAGIDSVSQTLDLWTGEITSHFTHNGNAHYVRTTCHGERDMIAASIDYTTRITPLCLRLPYPTMKHTDGASDWQSATLHESFISRQDEHSAVITHILDSTTYHIHLSWEGKASVTNSAPHTFTIQPASRHFELTCEFLPTEAEAQHAARKTYSDVRGSSENHCRTFWTEGGFVDFGRCKDTRAYELERRVILSQYLLAVQCAGSIPPQETGLTMNSWFGKFHLEMIIWHQAWLALWGHEHRLMRTLDWYFKAIPMAKQIAERQGFKGVRWMKMTDPSGAEAPSNVGSFLIWQQPHPIYLAELCYRALKTDEERERFVTHYMPIIQQTADFMCSFVQPADKSRRRSRHNPRKYELRGYIPAQESLKASVTRNSPFELSQWHTTLAMANLWRERNGQARNRQWDNICNGLPCLAYNSDSLYLAAESATDTYINIKATSDHPALLGALGFFPDSRLIDKGVMQNSLSWVHDNWNWPTAWGWDFPMAAMTATRLNLPESAISFLLHKAGKNTYLVNGHNYQDSRLRLYLPGNGALLSSIALMCAGWDGCNAYTPGFPADGTWDVRWEGINPLP